MKIRRCMLLVTMVLILGCSSGDSKFQARLDSYDDFAQQVYDALAWEDVDALCAFSAQPGDRDLDGCALVPQGYGYDDEAAYRQHLDRKARKFIEDLNSLGGTPDMKLVRIGKPIGLMGTKIDFVGNMFLIVELGGRQHAIEVGSTQLSRNRGRVILPGTAFALKDMQYYQELAQVF